MKLVAVLILGLSLNAFAAKEELDKAPEGPNNGQVTDTATEAATGDCDLHKMQLALAQQAENQRKGIKEIKKGDKIMKLEKVDPNETVVASVSNDPFGQPCTYR